MHLLGDDHLDPALSTLLAEPTMGHGIDPHALARAIAAGAQLTYVRERGRVLGPRAGGAALRGARQERRRARPRHASSPTTSSPRSPRAVREARLVNAGLVAGPDRGADRPRPRVRPPLRRGRLAGRAHRVEELGSGLVEDRAAARRAVARGRAPTGWRCGATPRRRRAADSRADGRPRSSGSGRSRSRAPPSPRGCRPASPAGRWSRTTSAPARARRTRPASSAWRAGSTPT